MLRNSLRLMCTYMYVYLKIAKLLTICQIASRMWKKGPIVWIWFCVILFVWSDLCCFTLFDRYDHRDTAIVPQNLTYALNIKFWYTPWYLCYYYLFVKCTFFSSNESEWNEIPLLCYVPMVIANVNCQQPNEKIWRIWCGFFILLPLPFWWILFIYSGNKKYCWHMPKVMCDMRYGILS